LQQDKKNDWIFR